MLAAEMQTLTV